MTMTEMQPAAPGEASAGSDSDDKAPQFQPASLDALRAAVAEGDIACSMAALDPLLGALCRVLGSTSFAEDFDLDGLDVTHEQIDAIVELLDDCHGNIVSWFVDEYGVIDETHRATIAIVERELSTPSVDLDLEDDDEDDDEGED